MMMHDELDHLLAPSKPEGDAPEALSATLPVLRRRRWVRRGIQGMAWAACFLGGMLTMNLMRTEPEPEVRYVRIREEPKAEEPTPAEKATDLEWRAVDSREPRPDLFRRAGDRYWEEERDPVAALRCYRRAIEQGSEESLEITSDDSWLMIALKDAHKEEMDER